MRFPFRQQKSTVVVVDAELREKVEFVAAKLQAKEVCQGGGDGKPQQRKPSSSHRMPVSRRSSCPSLSGDSCDSRQIPRRRSSLVSDPSDGEGCGGNGGGRQQRRRSSVTFAESIVSDVFDVPEFDLEDKQDLFYEPEEIRTFKRNYRKHKKQKVRFDTKANKVKTCRYHTPEEVERLYFNLNDIRRFENEFLYKMNTKKNTKKTNPAESEVAATSEPGGEPNVDDDEVDEMNYNTNLGYVVVTCRRFRDAVDSTCGGSFGPNIHRMCPRMAKEKGQPTPPQPRGGTGRARRNNGPRASPKRQDSGSSVEERRRSRASAA